MLDGEHPDIGAALILTGRVRTARGDGTGALMALDKARGIFERLYGPRSPAVGDVDFYAAEAESARGDTAAALRRLANTKLIYDASYGADDPDQVELLMVPGHTIYQGRANRKRAQRHQYRRRPGRIRRRFHYDFIKRRILVFSEPVLRRQVHDLRFDNVGVHADQHRWR